MKQQTGSNRTANLLFGLAVLLAAGTAGWLFAPGFGDAGNTETRAFDLDAPVGGPFTLTGVDGRPVSDETFRGKYMLIVFGYTFCPDICPVSLLTVGRALDDIAAESPERVAKVAPIFITLDPERDTPEAVGRYLKSFSGRFTGLSGSPDEIRHVAMSYGVRYEKVEDEMMNDYLIDHSISILLMDPSGGYLTNFSPRTPPYLLAEGLERFLRD